MIILYRLLTSLILVLSPIILIIRLLKKKEDPKRFKEKFCFFSEKKNKGDLIWFHGASVGELQSVVPLIEKLDKNPNLIVLDLEMPRMDGFEFLENYMKEVNETERAPVLVYSGKDLTEVQREMLEKNVAGMVKKDEVSMDELSAIVSNIYNQ